MVHDSNARARHRVVIIGSGFGGLFAAKALRRAPVDVTLVSNTPLHVFQPLLYQVATGILSTGEIAPATREILRRQGNARVLFGHVTDIDLVKREIAADVADQLSYRIPYDSLVVAAGADQSYFGNDHFAEWAPGMKTIDHALELRGRIYGAFELAEADPASGRLETWLTFVVVGAGPTGVEMAGQIAELAKRTLPGNFRRVDTTRARVILLDAAPRVLGAFSEHFAGVAARRLEALGVELRLNSKVVDVSQYGIEVEHGDGTREQIPAWCKIWAAGVTASPLGRLLGAASGAKVDRAGRVHVQPDLTLPGHPEVFVVGDMMALDGLPGVAQVAIQGGRYAARTILRRLRGQAPPGPFKYFDKGNMATIARFQALVQMGRIEFSGFVAWLAWLFVHLAYLVGFKNRFTTLVHWIVSFAGRGRPERTVTVQQIAARQGLQRLARLTEDGA
jgi:NADH dehydrogenase